MRSDSLECLGPLDGRYADLAAPLRECFSELALIRRRAEVEAEWLIRVNDIPQLRKMKLDAKGRAKIRAVASGVGLREARRVKALERRTRHDVKALEYWMAGELRGAGFSDLRPLLHFACTSWDINNIAFSLSVREAVRNVMVPALGELQTALAARAREWAGVPMLARTHGQPASPTTVGKEMAVFAARIAPRLQRLESANLPAKANGATGNYGAHFAALPDFDWPGFCQKFVESFGLRFAPLTTQIEPYDDFGDLCNLLRGVNGVVQDFAVDMWLYVLLESFVQRTAAGEVGSSTMPHKVNPIDFENAEGNLGVGSALLSHLSGKLPMSRLQRDLSDSTVLRAVGTAFGHSLIAWRSALRGLEKVGPNRARLDSDLDSHWEVLSEAAQTLLRADGAANAYEILKSRTRGAPPADANAMRDFARALPFSDESRNRMSALTPRSYVGAAKTLADDEKKRQKKKPKKGKGSGIPPASKN